MMFHIPRVLTPDQAATMRHTLDHADWTGGRPTAGVPDAHATHCQQLPADSPVTTELGRIILKALAANPLYFAAALPLRTVPPLFNRYTGGDRYGAHVDGAVRNVSGSALPLRTDLSCTLFLCEPEDYDGGELMVNDTYGVHEVKLPAGDMIVYPSSSVHKVEPVTRGNRVCSFFWVQSMVRDDGRRAMLLELDQTILRLRSKLGDTEETVSLAGHYHNLLRMWSEI